MSDQQDRGAHLRQDAIELLPQRRVQATRGLVEQQEAGLAHQGAGDGAALLLAAGKLWRIAAGHLGEAKAIEQVGDRQ